jgi:DNA-binding ferritin-like protein (Dps family)
MGIQEAIEGKREWRAHVARVKKLPPDYEIVYWELQKYLFKVGGGEALADLLNFFEEGAAAGKGVLDLTGSDVAAFADDLVMGLQTHAEPNQKLPGDRRAD